jgi:uncharacterized protein YigA (DUF484 family)
MSEHEPERRIAEYLLAHPDFFERHPRVLEQLRVSHPSGAAVSLIERQRDLLRAENHKLRDRLQDLVQVARDNDSLSKHMQQLNLALIEARRLDELVLGVQSVLRDEFGADFTALRLAMSSGRAGLADSDRLTIPALEALRPLLHGKRPWCGRLGPDQARWLFDEVASEVASTALLPLSADADWQGVLAIGSRCPERFAPGMGTVFLSRIGELVSHAVNLHLCPLDSSAVP